ncbi:hypothetical protein EJB05_10502, partial [Eragrostis curvula]
MAAAEVYGDDDDEFDEYNPHPYSGGYDIFSTYGSPLPPTPTTCYPVSSPAAVVAPTAPQPSSTSAAIFASAAAARACSSPAVSASAAATDLAALAAAPGSPGGAVLLAGTWMRGLDYLFGHSDGYGERRIGEDCLGVPVYANRKGAVEDAVVVVEVPPPATETLQWHYAGEEPDRSNGLSWYSSSAEEETPAYANAEPAYYSSYDRPYYEQSYSFQGVPEEPSWSLNQSYQEAYKEEEDSQYQEYLSYDTDAYKISSQPIVSYNQHFGEQPLHVHVEPPEAVSSHRLEYYENCSTYANENDVDNWDSSRHSYEIQPYLHTPDDQLEPYRPSWSQNLEYYQACTEGVSHDSDNHTMASGESWDMSSLFASPFYPQETHIYEQSYGDEYV